MAFASTVLWIGIWLTGFNNVHWLLYVPPAVMSFAAVTSICPGMFLSRTITGA